MRTPPAVDVVRYSRGEFLDEVWEYRPGEHATILAPSGGGKTHLGYQLLDATATVEVPAVVLVMKPRDSTVSKFSKQAKFRTVRQWPPPPVRSVLQGKTRGWVLWPPHTFNPDMDDAVQKAIFTRAVLDCYKRGNRIIFADETYSLENELPAGGLTKPIRTVHTKGRSMGCGMWSASQRAAYINKWAYQAHHLFLGHDPDDDAQQRLSEIGAAVDKRLVRHTVGNLAQHEFLYINRDDRTMCIVEA